MTVETLPRLSVENVQSAFSDERKKLLADSAKELGYTVANPKSLLQRLLAIDIMPFKQPAVDAYKASKEHEGMYSGTFWCLMHILFCTITIPLFVMGAVYSDPKSGWQYGLMFGVCLFLTIADGVFAFLIWPHCNENWGTGTRTVTHWLQDRLEYYRGGIPDHVLNTALTIKRAIPECSFTVESLVQTEQRVEPRYLNDPFLIVKLGNESYYAEQWEEKDLPRLEV